MAEVPAKAKKPSDHKAAKAEAEDGPITFEHEGGSWTVDREAFSDIELFEAVEDGHYIKAIRGYLGVEQWNRFKESIRDDSGRVPMDKFEPFLNALMGALGQGN